jgi:hypothetical protein
MRRRGWKRKVEVEKDDSGRGREQWRTRVEAKMGERREIQKERGTKGGLIPMKKEEGGKQGGGERWEIRRGSHIPTPAEVNEETPEPLLSLPQRMSLNQYSGMHCSQNLNHALLVVASVDL